MEVDRIAYPEQSLDLEGVVGKPVRVQIPLPPFQRRRRAASS
jgi:hypothetical protein